MKFGFCVPVFANPGPAFFRTPAATEAEVRSIARRIAALPASRRGVPRADVLSALESGDGQPLSAVVDDWLVGTPEAITDQLRTYERLGITHVMLWFLDYPSLDGMRLFSEHVLRTMQTDSPPLAAHAVTRR